MREERPMNHEQIEPPLRSFDQESIEDSDQIALYSILITVIDKDIDAIRSENAREGLSIWGILGAIVTGLAFLFGRTAQIEAIPSETSEVACVSLILLYLLYLLFNV